MYTIIINLKGGYEFEREQGEIVQHEVTHTQKDKYGMYLLLCGY